MNGNGWSARANDGWSGMDDDWRPGAADDWWPADDYRWRRLVDDLHRWPVDWLWLYIDGLDRLWHHHWLVLLHGHGLRRHHLLLLGLLVVHLSNCAWCGVVVVHISI